MNSTSRFHQRTDSDWRTAMGVTKINLLSKGTILEDNYVKWNSIYLKHMILQFHPHDPFITKHTAWTSHYPPDNHYASHL